MGSLVFQEIREFRSLAYSCGAGYISPFYSDNKGYFNGYIGCQADKTIEACKTLEKLILDFPKNKFVINAKEKIQNYDCLEVNQ